MIRNLYPFSTIDGKVIPLDILRPLGVLRIPLTSIASALQDLGIAVPILILSSDVPCFVRFGDLAVAPGSSIISNEVYLDSGAVIAVAPHSSNISAISDGLDGTLIVQLIDRWAGLADELSYRG